MERFRAKRSKIAAPTDRTASAMKEGNRQIRNQRNFPKLASDLSSCTSGSTEEDSVGLVLILECTLLYNLILLFVILFTIELGPSSSKQAIGTPMKKLLAKEMSKEAEPKKRSPSVIARLMGLDGLPPQQPIHKQQKKKKNSKEQEEFKDVFEVLVAPKGESDCYQVEGQGTTNSKLTEAEKAFIRQKFMDAKRLSTDEKLQDSQEFHDALEVLDSNKDLLLKFLQEPDSLFTKHLQDLQGVPPQPHCRRITVSKSSNSPKYENNATGWKSKRGTSRKNDISSPQKHHDDHFSHSYGKHDAHKSLHPSRIQFEGRDETSVLPTRIVVLKPNLGKVLSSSKSISSPRSSYDFLSDCGKHTGSMSIRNKEAELQGSNEMGFSRHKSRESREIAKEVTRRMRNSITNGSMNFSSAGFRGYAGDESSCMSGNDSLSEPEETVLISRNSFDRSSRYRASSSHSTESSVSREARKRLSERWKMTRRFQEVGAVNRGSTLAEMLAISDKEVRSENLDSMIGQGGCSNSFSRNDGTSEWASPLGISSMDGWKDGCGRHLSRSRSLPASSDVFGSPKASMHHETQVDGCKKSQSSRDKSREHNDTLQEIYFNHNEMKCNLDEKGPSEEKPMISETSAYNATDTNLVVDTIVDEQENMAMSSESPDESLRELSTCIFVENNSSTHGLDDSIPQEPSNGSSEGSSVPLLGSVPEPESPSSSKEAEQPSPVSVLETTFPEDLSSGSECFERVSADLQGLRMQLQLLKLETDAYAEGSMVISSDEDAGVSEEMGIFRAEDSWESSYIADVLVDSGYSDSDPEMFVAGWESSECPLSPMIFEKLEKLYSDHTTGLKSERRLVFDRINSVLMEVFQPFVDPHPWVKIGSSVHSRWRKDRLNEEIYKLLARQEKMANDATLEKELERESEWLNLGVDVNAIGMEIERLVMDELVDEVVSM
ncbi:hypothetical protein CK203_074657 [Vitis vinifera]|uniref:DUF4378 domain-containing protein n=1 Tax=Vitis vinifera TaxID=29760 RepID=A0A438DWF1_VITVI|nr:hypothetical protein CK203_074657 [Vitis vinifera]